jgi:hypothetical protein
MEVLAEECAALADFAAEPGVRDVAKWSAPGATAAAAARLEVLPALLHLAARTALDTALDAGAEAGGESSGGGGDGGGGNPAGSRSRD